MLNTIILSLLFLVCVYKINLFLHYIRSIKTENLIENFKEKNGWFLSFLIFGIIGVLKYNNLILADYYIYVDLLVVLVLMSIIDFKYHIIPNGLNASLLVSLILLTIYNRASINIWYVLLLIFILTLIILGSKFIKDGVGMGDIKLLLIIMSFFGIAFIVYTVLFSLILMLVFVTPMLLAKKMTLKSQLPFVPFYTIGVLIFYIIQFI